MCDAAVQSRSKRHTSDSCSVDMDLTSDSCSVDMDLTSDETSSMPTSPDNIDQKAQETPYNCSQDSAAQSPSQGPSMPDSTHFLALGAIRVRTELQSELIELHNCVCVAGPHAGATVPETEVNLSIERGWMRTKFVQNQRIADHYSIQIFVLSETLGTGLRSKGCRRFLKHVIAFVDKSKAAWDGDWTLDTPFDSYLVCSEQESLFYLFNTLPSPSPSPESIQDMHARRTMKETLGNSIAGLKTKLYPYQQRSAAMMIQRETLPKRSPDPRKPCFFGPTGQPFYYDKEEGIILLEPSLYEEPKGGILAETMGYGKTLICLAVVLASRGLCSRIPDDRREITKMAGQKMATLVETAAARVISDSVPWKAEFGDLARRGFHHERCVEMLRHSFREYTEQLLTRQTPNRNGKRPRTKAVRLCSTTLIIVPPNLLVQWQDEIDKHTEMGALDVLTIDHSCQVIPGRDRLALYDIVLITKGRFDQEYRDDDLNTGKRTAGEEQYQSPLTDLRWLRVILDEGVGLASTATRTTAMVMLDKMYFDRRWVVSGTPSNSLRGVEVGLAANETVSEEDAGRENLQTTLQRRRNSDIADRESHDLDKLRMMVTKFLKVQPWANMPGSDYARWTKYLAPFDGTGQRRNVTGLRMLLESIILRHRFEDIEADLPLPPLHNKVVYLEPSFYDRLSINLFNLVLASNAVTSERTDQDYMFHARNRKVLDILITNLRRASFHWVGFKKDEVEEALQNSKNYMEKKGRKMSGADRALLIRAIKAGERAINDPGWLAFSTLHEIGVFVEDFPEHACETWALGQPSQPLLMGTVQARAAQNFIAEHGGDDDPAEGLPGAGLRSMQAARKRAAKEDKKAGKPRAAGSQLIEGPQIKDQTKHKRSLSSAENSPKKRPRLDFPLAHSSLAPTSPLRETKIVGTSSTKLSYLLSQIALHYRNSKIIIFYDTNNIAFWLAEALELLSYSFRIYSHTIPQKMRSHYLSLFNSSPDIRILLMDLRHASHGLHIAAADRIYIISPIWQPGVEAQAIKRAHRIGQTRPVYVETLVLRGTLEERMLRRRREMSNAELKRAERSLLDDGDMERIIREELGFLGFRREEEEGVAGRTARLRVSERLFGREESRS